MVNNALAPFPPKKPCSAPVRILVAITGASGAIFTQRLLDRLDHPLTLKRKLEPVNHHFHPTNQRLIQPIDARRVAVNEHAGKP